MKKLGFTLAEILITLAIVGVIAALTIPTVVTENKKQANVTKLAATMSALENAFTSMIVKETVNDLSETEFATTPTASILGKYIKVDSSGALTTFGYASNACTFPGIDTKSETAVIDTAYKLKNGAVVMFKKQNLSTSEKIAGPLGCSILSAIGYIVIDVNGKELPNVWGRDVFEFILGTDGLLYPLGGRICSIVSTGTVSHLWNKANSYRGCNDKRKSIGCTARLIENNFKIDY